MSIILCTVGKNLSKSWEIANANNTTNTKSQPEFNWNTFVPGFFAGGAIVATNGNILIAILNHRKDKQLQIIRAELARETVKINADLNRETESKKIEISDYYERERMKMEQVSKYDIDLRNKRIEAYEKLGQILPPFAFFSFEYIGFTKK